MNDDSNNPPRKKRTRGPYKLWVEKTGVPPRSTSQSLRRRLQVVHNDTGESNDGSLDAESRVTQHSPSPRPAEIVEDHLQLPEEQPHADLMEVDEPESTEGPLCIGDCICGGCQPLEPNNDVTAGNTSRKDRYKWDEPLLPSVPTTKFEVFLMVLHLCLRHGMTGALVEDLLMFVNSVLGEDVIPTSEYIFRKLFQSKSAMCVHFYCPSCECYLGEKNDFDVTTVPCPNCNFVCNVQKLTDNFFLTISVRDQIEHLLQHSDVKLLSREGRPQGIYCDILDGEIYKKLTQAGNLMSDKNSISLTFNTDGAQVFKSTKGSLWPVQCVINELPPKVRFESKNVILCALWFGKGSPNMTALLKPFKNELNSLAEDGVFKQQPDGSFVKCPVFALVCSVDSVAKPKIQCLKQFNGSYGCGYCLHPNLSVEGNQLRYISVGDDGRYLHFPYRSHEGMLNDMCEAYDLDEAGLLVKSKVGTSEETQDHVNGLKGISVLADLKGFDLVFGFTIDYLHQLLKGVTETVVQLLCDGPTKSKQFWKDEKYDLLKLDRRLEAIKPPQGMSTRSKAISSRSEWKAKDWRSLLLYYILPCTKDLFAEANFENLKNLVTASHILLSDKITSDQLCTAATLLQEFVVKFNILYGSENITYNIHLCTHLAYIVRCWGPLWAYSTFVFESGNGHLTRLVKGTRGVITQICRKHLTVQSVSKHLESHKVSDKILMFCSDIMSYKYAKRSDKFGDVRTFGAERLSDISDEEKQALNEANIVLPSNQIIYFNRIVRNDVSFYCKAYTKPGRFDDTCVSMVDNSFSIIEKFVEIPGSTILWAFIRPVRVAEVEYLAPHIFTCASNMFGLLKIVPFSEVSRKCVRVEFESENQKKNYICTLPNVYEKD